jgi:predicted AlkP superfamily pyrophosphatase or phosphodiesterase
MYTMEDSMPVVFILIDGLRPDAIEAARCPNLRALRARAAATMRAQSVMPSVTLPCHTSIFHSVPPARHGITSNQWTPLARPLPGLFDLAHAAGKRTAFFYNWEELRDIGRPGSLDMSYFRNTSYQPDGDNITAGEAARVFAEGLPDFTFVYFGTVDTAGHYYGWMSEGYLSQLATVDRALGTLLDALPNDAAIILHSDHGGHDRNHGTDTPEDMTIPWLAAGPGIRQGYAIDTPVSLLDTAPTIARLLGIAPHHEWEGRCVEEIFD